MDEQEAFNVVDVLHDTSAKRFLVLDKKILI